MSSSTTVRLWMEIESDPSASPAFAAAGDSLALLVFSVNAARSAFRAEHDQEG